MPEEANIYGLAYSCPHLKRLVNCPLKQIENLSFLEKVKWIDNLSEEEKEALLEHHQHCSMNR
jgi:hypothetical protein